MDKTAIFSKTAKGIAALDERKHALSRDEYRLLGVVDGRSSLLELAEKVDLNQGVCEQILARLLADGLLNQHLVSSELNHLPSLAESTISVAELDPEEGVRAWAEAQRGVKGLTDSGYYAHTERPHVGGRPPRILSVEDDPLMAKLLTVLLTREGFEVKSAGNVAMAQQMLAEEMPDLAILDVMLPDGSGFQILEWIRNQPLLASLPVIMLTAQVSAEDVMHGLRSGADGYIFKPFTPEPLLQCIRSVLKL